MGQKTSIEWTDYTWSPLRVRVKTAAAKIAKAKGYTSLIQIANKMARHVGQHCEHVSSGCEYCYAEAGNHRCLPNNGTGLPYDRRARDLVEPFVDDKILTQPLHWKTPRRIFVENQSDLFGEWVSDETIDRVFAVMALCPQHTFQVLTKRPERMLKYISFPKRGHAVEAAVYEWHDSQEPTGYRLSNRLPVHPLNVGNQLGNLLEHPLWPLPNVWLGVSVEDQATADERIPLLLQTPAAVRFVSCEPTLGPVDFRDDWLLKSCATCGHDILNAWKHACLNCGGSAFVGPSIDWVIAGGESGPGARPFNIQWARKAIAQCRAAGVACFVKQLGAVPIDSRSGIIDCSNEPHAKKCNAVVLKDRKGGDWNEWPSDLRVREFPESQGAETSVQHKAKEHRV